MTIDSEKLERAIWSLTSMRHAHDEDDPIREDLWDAAYADAMLATLAEIETGN